MSSAIGDARREFLIVKQKHGEIQDAIHKDEQELQRLDEQIIRMDKSLHSLTMEARRSDKVLAGVQTELQEAKAISLPENKQVEDLTSFVTASKSIFTAKAFQDEWDLNEQRRQALIGRPGELLMEIAAIAESVVKLKEQTAELKRAQKELDTDKKQEKVSRDQIRLQNEQSKINQNSVTVKYQNMRGDEDYVLFPMITPDNYKITFAELQIYACKYWSLYDKTYVLVDQDYSIYPGSEIVFHELQYVEDKQRMTFLMSKEEAKYYRARQTQQDMQAIVSDDDEIERDKREAFDTLFEEQVALQKKKEHQEKLLQNDRERYKNVLNLLIYGLFLVLYTWVLLQPNNIKVFYNLRQSLKEQILEYPFPLDGSTSQTFDDIYLQEDMTNYLELTFIPSLFNDVKYNGEAYSDEERQYIRFNIKKVGQVRFLQKRVNSKSCTSSFSENLGRPLDACFDDYSEEDEFTDDIPFPSHIDSKYSPWFLYDSEESPRQVDGQSFSYKLNGYKAYIDPSASLEEAQQDLQVILKQWVNLQTRVLVIDNTMCNIFADICAAFEIIFEFVAGGAIIIKDNIYLFRINRNWSSSDQLRIGFDCCIGAIMLYFIFDLIMRIKRTITSIRNRKAHEREMGVETFSAKASYWKLFGNIWIYLEIILILMLTTKHLAIIAYQDMELIRNFSTTEIKYKDYMQVAYIYGLINNFEGVSSFIAYLTVLRFFQKSESLRIIWGTLGHSMKKMIFFFLVFLLVFAGWTLMAYRGFGQYLEEYRNIGTTVSTLLKILLGEVEFDSLYESQPEFSGLFFFFFVFLNYFIMLNIFLAIINESYDFQYKDIKQRQQRKGQRKDEMIIMMGIIFQGIKMLILTFPKRIFTFYYCRKHKVDQNVSSSSSSDKSVEEEEDVSEFR